MNKIEFLQALREGLDGLPTEDIEKSVDYYDEILSDCIEDGMGEEEAVESLGKVENIVDQIIADVPLKKLVRNKPKRKWSGWEITLLVLGAPLWLSLLAAAFTLVVTAYVLLWTAVVVYIAADVAFAASVLEGIFLLVVCLSSGNVAGGLLSVGVGCILAGLSVLMVFGIKPAVKGAWWLSKAPVRLMKKSLIKKRGGKTV